MGRLGNAHTVLSVRWTFAFLVIEEQCASTWPACGVRVIGLAFTGTRLHGSKSTYRRNLNLESQLTAGLVGGRRETSAVSSLECFILRLDDVQGRVRALRASRQRIR